MENNPYTVYSRTHRGITVFIASNHDSSIGLQSQSLKELAQRIKEHGITTILFEITEKIVLADNKSPFFLKKLSPNECVDLYDWLVELS